MSGDEAADSNSKMKTAQTKQAAEKLTLLVIQSGAKNLSSIQAQAKDQRGILRFAQNDNFLSFFAASKACSTSRFWHCNFHWNSRVTTEGLPGKFEAK